MCMNHDNSLPEIESQGDRSRSKLAQDHAPFTHVLTLVFFSSAAQQRAARRMCERHHRNTRSYYLSRSNAHRMCERPLSVGKVEQPIAFVHMTLSV